jgi:DNA-binding NarL/FixJ family response regulator
MPDKPNEFEEQRRLAALTRRQSEVLERAALGQTNAELAAALGVTTHAIKFHLASAFRALGVKNRTEAAVVYNRLRGARP